MESMVGQLVLSHITTLAQAVATLIEQNGAHWRLFPEWRPIGNFLPEMQLLSIFELNNVRKSRKAQLVS